jgi:hypothetical protein
VETTTEPSKKKNKAPALEKIKNINSALLFSVSAISAGFSARNHTSHGHFLSLIMV